MAGREDSIDVSQAQARLLEVLDRVQAGESFSIVRAGVPVARLTPVPPLKSPAEKHAAIEAMRVLARGNRLDGLDPRELRNDGRKY